MLFKDAEVIVFRVSMDRSVQLK